MKTLILIRHAVFDRSDPQVADVNRTLSRLGQQQAADTAARLNAAGIKPDFIISSPARRAQETALIYAKELEIPQGKTRVEAEIYEAGRAEILRVVQSLSDDCERVALVGHHPGVTLLLQHLVDCDIDLMKEGSFVALEFPVERWSLLSFKQGVLLCSAEPKGKATDYGWRSRLAFWRQ